uniref:Uncharacterized protein n=1 Tax=Avena sativa TaxID=4498 RepID=A0ACD5Y0H7_AVESA
MPRANSKASFDGDELQELRLLRQELNEDRKDTDKLRLEVSQIRTDMSSMNKKQSEVIEAVTDMHSAVGNISTQLAVMSNAINSLRQPTVDHTTIPDKPAPEAQKSPTFQQQPTAQLTKKRLLEEQEKTQYMELVTSGKLAPINTGRRSAPPGFAGLQKHVQHHRGNTPKQAHTPVFHAFQQQQPKLQQLWEGYARDYEKEMRINFFKSITKGPRMDFPKFDVDNPVGWIRQCEKFFQMAAAPEEYKVHLA